MNILFWGLKSNILSQNSPLVTLLFGFCLLWQGPILLSLLFFVISSPFCFLVVQDGVGLSCLYLSSSHSRVSHFSKNLWFLLFRKVYTILNAKMKQRPLFFEIRCSQMQWWTDLEVTKKFQIIVAFLFWLFPDSWSCCWTGLRTTTMYLSVDPQK